MDDKYDSHGNSNTQSPTPSPTLNPMKGLPTAYWKWTRLMQQFMGSAPLPSSRLPLRFSPRRGPEILRSGAGFFVWESNWSRMPVGAAPFSGTTGPRKRGRGGGVCLFPYLGIMLGRERERERNDSGITRTRRGSTQRATFFKSTRDLLAVRRAELRPPPGTGWGCSWSRRRWGSRTPAARWPERATHFHAEKIEKKN